MRQPSFVFKRMCVNGACTESGCASIQSPKVRQAVTCGVSKQRGREGKPCYPTKVDGRKISIKLDTLGKQPGPRTLNGSRPDQRTPVAPNMRYARYHERSRWTGVKKQMYKNSPNPGLYPQGVQPRQQGSLQHSNEVCKACNEVSKVTGTQASARESLNWTNLQWGFYAHQTFHPCGIEFLSPHDPIRMRRHQNTVFTAPRPQILVFWR